jgi:hypothetical protein
LDLLTALTYFSALAFVYFGIGCFNSKFIVSEFKRYGLAGYRKLTGVLQLLGAVGLVVGLRYSPVLLLCAAAGLSLLMMAGFAVRMRIRDNFVQSFPAFTFAALNLLIAVKTFIKHFL